MIYLMINNVRFVNSTNAVVVVGNKPYSRCLRRPNFQEIGGIIAVVKHMMTTSFIGRVLGSLLEAGGLVVLVEVGFEGKRFVAPSAGVVLEGRVCLHVSTQIRPVGESLATVGAPEGFLASVRTHVALKQPRSREGFATYAALVAQIVREKVHGQSRHAYVYLATGFALFGLLGVRTSVSLLMAR